MLDLFSIEHLSRKLAICFGSVTVRCVFEYRLPLDRSFGELDGLRMVCLVDQISKAAP